MICAQHNWWDAAPCPSCEPVTVTETPPAPSLYDSLEIPAFLRRNPDNSFMHPEALPCTIAQSVAQATRSGTSVVTIPDVLTDVTDAQLMEWVDTPSLTCLARQPVYRELQAREDRRKSRARIEAMLEKKRAAVDPPCKSGT